jgi:hypothetical protein
MSYLSGISLSGCRLRTLAETFCAWNPPRLSPVAIGATYAIASAAIVRRDGSRLPLAVRAITTVVFTGTPLMAGVLFLLHHRIASTPAGAR